MLRPWEIITFDSENLSKILFFLDNYGPQYKRSQVALQQSSGYTSKHLDISGQQEVQLSQHPEAFLRGLERNVSFLKCDKKCESLHSLREQSRFHAGLRLSVREIPLEALLPSQCVYAVLLVISYKGKKTK